MNIYAEKGHEVRFLNKNGHDHEPLEAVEAGLVEGGIYTVEHVAVGGWMSYVSLEEFPNVSFNTVMFEDAEIDEVKNFRFLKNPTLQMIRDRGRATPAEAMLLLDDIEAYQMKIAELQKPKERIDPMSTLLTLEGFRKLEAELDDIKNVQFPRVEKRANDAKERKDIEEIKDAIKEQEFYNSRILKLSHMLKTAKTKGDVEHG